MAHAGSVSKVLGSQEEARSHEAETAEKQKARVSLTPPAGVRDLAVPGRERAPGKRRDPHPCPLPLSGAVAVRGLQEGAQKCPAGAKVRRCSNLGRGILAGGMRLTWCSGVKVQRSYMGLLATAPRKGRFGGQPGRSKLLPY